MTSRTALSVANEGARHGRKANERRDEMKYKKELARRMYLYFTTFCESVGAPSFQKFARSIGVTLAELESFRKHTVFERAWRECIEIRRDFLIDSALSKRFDSSFTKFLLSDEVSVKDGEDKGLCVSLEVID